MAMQTEIGKMRADAYNADSVEQMAEWAEDSFRYMKACYDNEVRVNGHTTMFGRQLMDDMLTFQRLAKELRTVGGYIKTPNHVASKEA